MSIARAPHGSVELAYERIGPPDGEPVLLVMGLAMQMLAWPDEFCAALVEQGSSVVRFDNRDVGLSTHLSGGSLAGALRGHGPYRLEDMAADSVAVLDSVGWNSAHVVGISMGGMIAQMMAIRHAGRMRSLTSMSSTPYRRIGTATARAALALAIPRRGGREEAQRRSVAVFRVIGSPGYPIDEQGLRDVAGRSYDRASDPRGAVRQLAAINGGDDRRPGLARVRLPTLVMHGEADPLVRIAGGRATAAAVPDAKLVTYPGMGHDMPKALWPMFVEEIAEVAKRANGY